MFMADVLVWLNTYFQGTLFFDHSGKLNKKNLVLLGRFAGSPSYQAEALVKSAKHGTLTSRP